MKTARALCLVTLVAGLGMLAPLTKPQSIAASETPSNMDDSSSSTPTPRPLDLTYHRPSNKTKLRNYLFDTIGPYPIAGAAFVALSGPDPSGRSTP
jgi:hypothetical protein